MTEYRSVYQDFIESELKVARERRVDLEARGGVVVTQSGTLSTLLIAAAAFVRGSAAAALPAYAEILVVVSTFLFLGAGVLGILVSFPFLYRGHPVASEATMDKMLTVRRADSEADARTVVATVHRATLAGMNAGNDRKVLLLSCAQIGQIAGLVTLLAGVVVAILG